MAHCNRCNKFSLHHYPNGYCRNCAIIVARETEERKRTEEKAGISAEEDCIHRGKIEETSGNDMAIMALITKQLWQKEDMLKMRHSIQLNLCGGHVDFFFYNVDIDGLDSSSKKLLSVMQLMRPDGSRILMYFTRPSLQSKEFKVYTLSEPNIPQLSRLNNNDFDRIFSWAACGWYKSNQRQFPDGFDFERLHPSCKNLNENLFNRDHIIEQNCNFVPKPLHTMLFGNLYEL